VDQAFSGESETRMSRDKQREHSPDSIPSAAFVASRAGEELLEWYKWVTIRRIRRAAVEYHPAETSRAAAGSGLERPQNSWLRPGGVRRAWILPGCARDAASLFVTGDRVQKPSVKTATPARMKLNKLKAPTALTRTIRVTVCMARFGLLTLDLAIEQRFVFPIC